MHRKQLRQVYLDNFENLKLHIRIINELIKLKINDLYVTLHSLEVDIDPIMIGWLLSLMMNVIPLEHAHLMVDLFIEWSYRGIYRVIICYLVNLKEDLELRQDASDILYRLSSTYPQEDTPWS